MDNIKIEELNALSPMVIAKQATINIGTIGHVAHGKSTLVKAISGVQTVRFKSELERNITIKLGYANAKIFKCPSCPRPGCFRSYGSSEKSPTCEHCGKDMVLIRHVSFVDCFGPEVKFATPTGVIANKDITPGSILLGPDGAARTVGEVEDGQKMMYEVKFTTSRTKGLEQEAFTCSGGHLLCLRIDTPVDRPVNDRSKKGGKYFVKRFIGSADGIASTEVYFTSKKMAEEYYSKADKAPVVFTLTVEAFLASSETIRTKARMYLANPMVFPGPHVNLAVGEATAAEVAWLTGLWLGAGDALQTRFTLSKSGDGEIKARIAEIAGKMGLKVVTKESSNRDAVWINLSTASGSARNPFYRVLEGLGLLNNKHVPASLMANTAAVRNALAAGFIDVDGTYNSGQFDLEQSEAQHTELFQGFVRLIRTLGFVAHVTHREVIVEGAKHAKLRVHFNGPSDELPIASVSKRGAPLQRAWAMSVPFTVREMAQAPYRKWAVNGDGLVLLETFVVAHNCPGHDILMATMLNGAAVMDAALLIIAGNESCPQPQTSEHLAAIEIMKLKHIIIVQNKIDLIKQATAEEQYQQILKFVKGTVADGAPIIPISAQLKYNIDTVCEYITRTVPVPQRDFLSPPRLIVIRSFDVNKPGAEVDQLKGGVAGGSILRGVFRVGDEIEVRPGVLMKGEDGKPKCRPIFSKVISLYAEQNDLQIAVPGGLIGVGTKIDPTLCRADRLVGQVLGAVGNLPPIFSEIKVNYFLLRRLLGVKTADKQQSRVQKLAKGEILMVNIGSTSTGGRIVSVVGDQAQIALTSPACTEVGEKIALSRRIERHWRLIGWGQIVEGVTIDVDSK